MSERQRIRTSVGELSVRVTGREDLPAALLWHSLFVDERSWSRVRNELAGDRRLVLVTGPGHGDSGDRGSRYDLHDCAAAAETVLDGLGLPGAVDWVGNAWGGHVGVVFAATRPRRCRTLVTIGTPVHAYRLVDRLQTRILLLAYRALGPAPFLTKAVTDALLSPATRAGDPGAVELVRNSFSSADRSGLANAVVSISLHRPDLSPLLPRVQAPTLFVTGTDHPDWPPGRAEAASRLLPRGAVAVVDDAAYLAPLEAPAEVARLVRDFWAAHGGSDDTPQGASAP